MTAMFEVIGIGVLVSTAINLVNKKMIDQDKKDEVSLKMKEIQKRMKEARKEKDQDKIKAIEKEQMAALKENMSMLKGNLKPMLYTTPPALAIFWYLNETYGPLGFIAELPLYGPVGWLGLYIATSLVTFIVIESIWKQYRKRKANGKTSTKE